MVDTLSYLRNRFGIALFLLILLIILGLSLKGFASGDEILYLGVSRVYASNYISNISIPLPFIKTDFINDVPNFVYPLLLSIGYFFESIELFNYWTAFLNSVLWITSSSLLYQYSMRQGLSKWFAICLFITSLFMPYCIFIGLAMTESLYYLSVSIYIIYSSSLLSKYYEDNKLKHLLILALLMVFAKLCKITLVILPLVFAVQVGAATFLTCKLKQGIRALFIVIVTYISVSYMVNHIIGRSELGRYSNDINIYNFHSLLDIIWTFIFSVINISSLLLFTPLLAFKNFIEKFAAKDINLESAIFSFGLIATSLILMFVMSIHSVSHLEWAYPNQKLIVIHERVYGFVVPLAFFYACLFISDEKVFDLKFLSIASLFLTGFLCLKYNYSIEPGIEFTVVPEFAFSKVFKFNPLFFPLSGMFVLAILISIFKKFKILIYYVPAYMVILTCVNLYYTTPFYNTFDKKFPSFDNYSCVVISPDVIDSPELTQLLVHINITVHQTRDESECLSRKVYYVVNESSVKNYQPSQHYYKFSIMNK